MNDPAYYAYLVQAAMTDDQDSLPVVESMK